MQPKLPPLHRPPKTPCEPLYEAGSEGTASRSTAAPAIRVLNPQSSARLHAWRAERGGLGLERGQQRGEDPLAAPMTTMWGAPAVTGEKGNGLKQLLFHGRTAQLRIGHTHKSRPFPPQAGGGLQPHATAPPGPSLQIPPGPGRSRRGAGKGQPHFSLSTPKHRKELTEEIPALSMHVSGYSPSSKRRWKRWANTHICAAAASPGSPPT